MRVADLIGELERIGWDEEVGIDICNNLYTDFEVDSGFYLELEERGGEIIGSVAKRCVTIKMMKKDGGDE